ncbi:MAG TPA: DMT family transporter [Acetobacteraceae bacterium]|nr:DMT family transporter [Acetobacteraceae bacterium]
MVRRPPMVPLLGLLTLCLVWGLSVPLTKLGLQEFPPLLLATLRYLTAAPLFALLLIGRPLPSRRGLFAMAGLGVLGIDCGQVMQVLGVQDISASVATIFTATIPVFVVVLASWRLRQTLRLSHALGLGLALLGIAEVATHGDWQAFAGLSATALRGDVLMLVSAVSVALYYVLSAELAQRHSVVTVAAWSSLFGVAPLLMALPWEWHAAPIRPGLLGIGVVLYLGVLVTVAGIWIWLNVLRVLPARIAASTQYLQPLIGVAASAALFGDPIDGSFAAGTVLVFIGIALTTLQRATRRPS